MTALDSICLLRQVAHVPCLTCGMTRAFEHLADGDWRGALAWHPWAPALVAQAGGGVLWWGTAILRRTPRPDRWLPHAVALNAAALLVVWVVRLATGTLPPM